MDRYILVTGASGFLGSWLCAALCASGAKVLGIGRRRNGGFLSRTLLARNNNDRHTNFAHENFIYECLELKNLNENSLKKYEFSLAFHLASMVEYASHDYHDYHDYTITPTLRLIDFATTRNIPKIIFTSTASVFAHPPSPESSPTSSLDSIAIESSATLKLDSSNFKSPYHVTQEPIITESSPIAPLSNYALAKYICESLLLLATRKNPHLQVITLRFPAIFGLHHLGGVVYEFAKSALEGKDIELFSNGAVYRNILYVQDAINALKSASRVQGLKPYELFLIGSLDSKPTSFIARTLIDALGSTSQLILSPKPSPNPFNSRLDISKAQQLLGFAPMSVEVGLQAYVRDILQNGGLQ
ncbi:NAD(P)-dependent oxidoreductase [Helicobacter jaachi]|uniref:NAD(P)-dependent oxidoreductase n=1 Tax=Helicobacter jaachi TaxID=1677920 RepID=A0A4U8TCN0_9HELI|nr:NAD(P)-dependent oxidoreductase [Helicobacter jaachi]TLD97740.1 NAD(P)-dependent oxidoreductase [Helicobacter jaachi]